MWQPYTDDKSGRGSIGRGGASFSGSRGFTLIEVTVSLMLLVIVLSLSFTVLFYMRAFAERQELFALPRQTARRAVDYLSQNIMSAGDQNTPVSRSVYSPNAIVAHYNGPGGGDTQGCVNNVTDPTTADLNTDILTINVPLGGVTMKALDWPAAGSNGAPSPLTLQYGWSCPDDAKNLQTFMDLTGFDPNTGQSRVLTLIDSSGAWSTYQITNYQQGSNATSCSDHTPPSFTVTGAVPTGMDPPGGRPALTSVVVASNELMAFRVYQGALQQKEGAFQPTADNPGNAFFTLLGNVEDLQIAYIYGNGTITSTVPTQAGPNNQAPPATDAVFVRGLRVSIVARSPRAIPNQVFARQRPINVEDHIWPANTPADNFYRCRLTATVMIRNRMLGD